jgi:hypothetical protein
LLRVSAKVSEAGKWRGPPFKHAVFDFTLSDMIDVDLRVHPSLRGIGLTRGEVEIELGPCAGAHGMIRCTIEKIDITPVESDQDAEASL